MANGLDLFIFKCAVSVDLYGVTANATGSALLNSGGTYWVPVHDVAALGEAVRGFDPETARRDIARQGCHWFTSDGPVEVYWGDISPPGQADAANG